MAHGIHLVCKQPSQLLGTPVCGAMAIAAGRPMANPATIVPNESGKFQTGRRCSRRATEGIAITIAGNPNTGKGNTRRDATVSIMAFFAAGIGHTPFAWLRAGKPKILLVKR